MNEPAYASNAYMTRSSTVPVTQMALRQPAAQVHSGGYDIGASSAHAISVMQRLGTCLEDEISALGATPLADLTLFGGRKGQGLMELNRVLSTIGPLVPGSAVALELATLHKLIDRNMRVLRLHVAAVKEIAGVLTDAIQDEQSDGTYSPTIQGKRRQR